MIFTDLLTGIGLGLIVGVLIILHRNYKNSHFLHLKDVIGENNAHTIKITLSEEVTFLNKAAILKELSVVQEGSNVTIDMSKSYSIDYDVLEIIDNFKSTAPEKNIEVSLINRGARKTQDY